MTEPTAKPETHFVRGLLVCPRCGNDVLEVVSDGEDTNFLCQDCWTCWHWELGWMTRVPPVTCPGCPHQQECLARALVDDATAHRA